MPVVWVSLGPAEHAALLAHLRPLSSPGRYLADVYRLHLAVLAELREAELRRLVLAYLPLAKGIARRMWRAHRRQAIPGTEGAGGLDLEEVEAAVVAELCDRVKHWDPDRGITLGAYAEAWLLAAARRAIQRTWGQPPEEEEPETLEEGEARAELAGQVAQLRGVARRAARAVEAGADLSIEEVRRLADALRPGAEVHLVPLREAAAAAGVPERTAQTWCKAGKIPAVRVDGTWHVPPGALRR